MYTIVELLKIKNVNAIQLILQNRINDKKIYLKNKIEGKLNIPYSDEIKKRAQIIGMAYSIAYKIFVAVTSTKYTIKEAIELDPRLNFDTINEATQYFKDNPELGFDSSLFFTLYNSVISLKTINFDQLAQISVLLTWIKMFIKTGFWPKDLTVIIPTNTENQLIQQEVIKLLESSKDFLETLAASTDLVINPTYDLKDLDLYDGADFLANGCLYIITSSENKYNNQLNTLKGLAILNEDHKLFKFNELSTYFARYNDKYTYGLNEEEIIENE